MADPFIALTIGGSAGPVAVARGQARTLRFAAADGEGGAAISVTGAAIEVRSPDGSEEILSGSDLTIAGTGIYTAVVTFDAAGTWIARATCAGPTAASSADLAVAVTASAADAPIPAPPAPWVQDAQQSAASAAQSAADAEASADAALATRLYFSTRTQAAAAAAAGLIAASVTVIVTGAHTAAGDDGGARYARTSAVATAAYGLSAGTLALVAFQDAGSDYWLLDEARPHCATVGSFGQALGVDPSTSIDEQPRWAALSEYLALVRGRGVIRYGVRNYYCHEYLDMRAFTGIEGPESQGRDPRSGDEVDTAAAVHGQPGLVFRSNKSLRYTDGFSLRFATVRRRGIVAHTDWPGALDAQVAITGTGMEKWGGGDATGVDIESVNFWGWAVAADLRKCTGLKINGFYFDGNTGPLYRQGGETLIAKGIKRKPILTTNDTVRIVVLPIVALFDAGGALGCEIDGSLSAAGLITGMRVASDKIPDPYAGIRRTVTVLTDATLALQDTAWDPDFADANLANADFSFIPYAASALNPAGPPLYNAGGKIGVRTVIDRYFQPGHYAVLDLGPLPQTQFTTVLTRVSARDFVVDVDWPTDAGEEAALLAVDLAVCEFSAMPNTRMHATALAQTGSRLGYGVVLVDGAGAYLEAATKGGAGFYLGVTATTANLRVEGGTKGDLEEDAPGGVGVYVTGDRNTLMGAIKSNSTAVVAAMDTRRSGLTLLGMELVNNRTAVLKLLTGRLFSVATSIRGEDVALLEDIDCFVSLLGDMRPEGAQGAVADLLRSHYLFAEQQEFHIASRTLVLRSRDSITGALADVGEIDAEGARFAVPVTAPNLVVPFTATGSTSGATAQALTSTGTAAAGAASGYSIETNLTARKLRIEIVAQRSNGTGSATNSESAIWDLTAIMSRGGSAGSTAIKRTGGLTSLPPTEYYDASGTEPSTWAVTLSTSSKNLVITVAGVSGADINWKATVTALAVT